jgi:hypothetical protein
MSSSIEEDFVADRTIVRDLAIVLPPQRRQRLKCRGFLIADLAARCTDSPCDDECCFA